jgi:replicase family protein/primase-like protein
MALTAERRRELFDYTGPAEPELVGRDDPRYSDLKYFPKPEEGQTWFQAREEQVAAAKARKRETRRETLTVSDNSRRHAGAGRDRAGEQRGLTRHASADGASDLRQEFPSLIPRKPYCADKLSDGLRIRSRSIALQKKHLQLNHPASLVWMAHDIDRPDAYFAHDDANLPRPNIIMVKPRNGHAHAAYLMAEPVATHSAARLEPLRFFAAVERGIARRLGADRQFAGLITKNPLHPDWQVEWRREEPYTLHELGESLFERDMRPDGTISTTHGAGRNVTVFDELRRIAYREFRQFKRENAPFAAWLRRCEEIALALNTQFPRALPLSEVRSIAKSVARWTWKRFSLESFSALQSFRGKQGMAKRWAGHESAEERQPWRAMGISRATYYRRKQQGMLDSDA